MTKFLNAAIGIICSYGFMSIAFAVVAYFLLVTFAPFIVVLGAGHLVKTAFKRFA